MNATQDGYDKGSEPHDYEIIEGVSAVTNRTGIIKDTVGSL